MKSLLISVLFFSVYVHADPIKVAILDSGVNAYSGLKLCPTGHYDFISNTPTVGADPIGHGTNEVTIISKYAKDADFCFLIYKIFNKKQGNKSIDLFALAIKAAIKNGANIISIAVDSNYESDDKELKAYELAREKGIEIIISAGNRSKDLDSNCNLYPICYPVSMTRVGNKGLQSNRGKIVEVLEAECEEGFCGTSASVAIFTGKVLYQATKIKQCKDELKQCLSTVSSLPKKVQDAQRSICIDQYKTCKGAK